MPPLRIHFMIVKYFAKAGKYALNKGFIGKERGEQESWKHKKNL
jgi:hypothetical protein